MNHRHRAFPSLRGGVGAAGLILTLAGVGGSLTAWKVTTNRRAAAAAANQPEPVEAVTAAVAVARQQRSVATAIGTVLALKSVTLRNEVAGTVQHSALTPGRIVEPGAILIALDVSVERAELRAREAQLALAGTSLKRLENLLTHQAVSAEEVDRARAERDVADAEIARIRAIIARKTLRAGFRARIGLSDVHPGQYLAEGTELTTLQSVDGSANIDFTVAQGIAAGLRVGDSLQVAPSESATPVTARIVAIDARVDPVTRNATVRARVSDPRHAFAPGASVRVRLPVGTTSLAVAIPVSSLRKGPDGDHVFVLTPDDQGKPRAHLRPVQTGEVVGDTVLVLSGLSPGERVAASGSFKLREGVLIAIADSAATLGKK